MVDDADALRDPGRRHPLRRRGPHLEVVRAHEEPGDALAEGVLHPRREARVAVQLRRVDESDEAVVGVLGAQVPEVVLERIGDPAAVDADVRRAVVLVHVVAERLLEQEVELAEVAEDDVPADVPGEAGGSVGTGVAARHRLLLEIVQSSWPSRRSSRPQARPHGPAP